MDPLPTARHIAHRGGAGARLFATAVTLLLTGVTAAQNPTSDPVILAIEPLLDSQSAVVRGEAALALAATGESKYHADILGLAVDPEPAARHRAILALGLLGQPGSDILLSRVLKKSARDSDERFLAALALGLLPDEPRVPAIDEFFNRASSASRKRIRTELVCVLIGFRKLPHPQRMTTLRGFISDATYRNRAELSLVIESLARVPSAQNREAFLGQLGTKNSEILMASLTALADRRVKFQRSHWERILHLAEHAPTPGVRARALDLLAFHRQAEALGVAGRALLGQAPESVAAAIRTVLTLGGSPLREGVEDRILATAEPMLQAAMLRAKKVPHGDDFVKACIAISRDAERSFEVRAGATKIVAEAGWKELLPTATQLFLSARDRESAERLALAMERLGATIDDKFLPAKTVEEVALLPMRLRALMSAGSVNAFKILLGLLTKPPSNGLQLDALRAYRSVRLDFLDNTSRALLPPLLRKLLE